MAAIRHITCNDGRNFHVLNQTFISLLPKKDGATNIADYRSISLVHGFHKIFAKALAVWVVPKMHLLTAKNQSAFIRDRAIQDNFMLVNQSIKTFHRHKAPVWSLKLDSTRDFDLASWPFSLQVMRKKGFGTRWCSSISLAISSASTTVLINGHPGKRNWRARWLRQGGPLSPLLFLPNCFFLKRATSPISFN